MAFSYTVTSVPGVIGNKNFRSGTYTNAAGDTGGDITTGLKYVEVFRTNCTSHAGSKNPKVTVSGGSVTLLTEDGVSGQWEAIGI